MRQVYFNGDFVPENEARISIYDSALMFGDMVFEMTRSFNKKQFKLREHLERLYMGIKILRIPIKLNIDENPQTPQKYGVRGIPTLMLFREGKLIDSKVGSLPKSSLEAWIQDNL